MPRYRRILLKLSGEVMAVQGSFGLDAARVKALAEEVAEVAKAGVQIGLVVGGGNFFRGVAAAAQHMDRVAADHMGMLATVINALALQDALEQQGVPTRVMTAITMNEVAEPYIRRRGHPASRRKRIVIFAAGTPNPFVLDRHGSDFTRSRNPRRHRRQGHARRRRLRQRRCKTPMPCASKEITYSDVLAKNLRVMDASAVAMCRDDELRIVVFNLGNVRQYNANGDGQSHRHPDFVSCHFLMKPEPQAPANHTFQNIQRAGDARQDPHG